MRARSISNYAAEQKESRSIRGTASHIRQEVNDRKSASTHPWCAFLIAGLFLLLNINRRSSRRPALRLREVEIETHAVHLLLRR